MLIPVVGCFSVDKKIIGRFDVTFCKVGFTVALVATTVGSGRFVTGVFVVYLVEVAAVVIFCVELIDVVTLGFDGKVVDTVEYFVVGVDCVVVFVVVVAAVVVVRLSGFFVVFIDIVAGDGDVNVVSVEKKINFGRKSIKNQNLLINFITESIRAPMAP